MGIDRNTTVSSIWHSSEEFWDGKRVLVTGGTGFVGRYVVSKLRERGAHDVLAPRSKDYDLRDMSDIDRLMRDYKPHVVIHLAARVGGIGANRLHPGLFFYENAIMGIQLMEQARLHAVSKFVTIGTVCAYPKFARVPFHEDDLWSGYPEETNAPYGLAKRMLLVQGQAYRHEYAFNAIYLLPVNLYGPGDNFDETTSHVIPSFIRRFDDALLSGQPRVINWGDGTSTREFLYVEDVADGIVLAAERYDGPEPVNLGSGTEISVRQLARVVADAMGYQGEIMWDTDKPNGQPRRRLDTSRARKYFGFEAATGFIDGIRATVDWYRREVRMRTTSLSSGVLLRMKD